MASASTMQPASHAFRRAYAGKRVLVTGHTGFKGAWLCEWLLKLGAEVTGYSLPPPTQPSLFEQLRLAARIQSVTADVRDLLRLHEVIDGPAFDFVFHLAAQPLVRLSYEQPVETYATNVMGTVNVLEAIRKRNARCAVVVVTTDKCYENREWLHGYREEDPMGGHDPYSSSKGAAELVVSAYRKSYFSGSSPVRLASARAGNVIGGGDWAMDRIVPDCIRALLAGRSIPVRNKVATRPWQHVLEPLSGYLWLGAALSGAAREQVRGRESLLTGAYNFGPELGANKSVADLVQEVLRHWPGSWEDCSDPDAPHEAKLLSLAIDKAHHVLGWSPVWDFEASIAQTVGWYRRVSERPDSAAAITLEQINNYEDCALAQGITWAVPFREPA